MTRMPMSRAILTGVGATCSSVMAAATTAIIPRSITPVASRTSISPEQHRLQCLWDKFTIL